MEGMKRPPTRQLAAAPGGSQPDQDQPGQNQPGQDQPGQDQDQAPDLASLMALVARGDHSAFERVYDQLAGPVYGVVRQVLRDPAQSEEIAQEVLLEVWRTASRFDPAKGSVIAWVMTMSHRRAVDRVRSENAGSRREQKAAVMLTEVEDVADVVAATLDQQRVRRCLDGLTGLQRESIELAYFGGYSYPEVAQLLGAALGTVKTRIRDGMIRMRDCLEVEW
jgi:RNA polymerase sigma-70 factor, ECF subfamily